MKSHSIPRPSTATAVALLAALLSVLLANLPGNAAAFSVRAPGTAGTPGKDFQHPPLRDAQAQPAPPRAPGLKPVDLNNASRADLMRLPGIGAAEADRIVEGRPYLSKASLVSQQVLPAQLYDGLRGRIYVGAVKGRPAPRVAGAASRP
ncbi:MAG: ComEA family DNA-binding protein [Pseudomonadota bacterium]|jgi:competence protein ComEA|nr:helix-hairpin-helix domain-containing protein [Rubrivivax sp.]MCA3258420.1 helix-hairpin-helix domain-containing protein [Rubrivivax sp.]MCE2911844.1 helix-hairpin-helix domain-containing protein [Rubrivivax sp.]MCZ8031630.1 helix-hairpin-helix domain-containing protein [Rubrivivax sp.]